MDFKTEIKGIVALIVLIFLSIGGCYLYKQGEDKVKTDQQTEIHTQKVDSVKLTQNRLDSVLQFKAICDKKTSKQVDSLKNELKLSYVKISYLKQRLNSNNTFVNSLPLDLVRDSLDKIEDKHSRELYADYLNAKVKDSIHTTDSVLIVGYLKRISIDSVDLSVADTALNMCLQANKSKASLIKFDEANIPKKRPLLNAIKKSYVWAISGIATIETMFLYLKYK